jgi:hypothetical protein
MANITDLFLANLAEVSMRRKRRIFRHSNTQGYPLREHIDLQHPLVELAGMIDWAAIDRVASEPFQPGPGRAILRPRLIAGLLYLQHAFNPSDEQVVAGWLENPYWQVFTGETHLQTEPPIDSACTNVFACRGQPIPGNRLHQDRHMHSMLH